MLNETVSYIQEFTVPAITISVIHSNRDLPGPFDKWLLNQAGHFSTHNSTFHTVSIQFMVTVLITHPL